MIKTNKGLTLVELFLVIIIFPILMGGVFILYRTGMRSWHKEEARSQIRQTAGWTVEKMVREIREAAIITAAQDTTLTFDGITYTWTDETDKLTRTANGTEILLAKDFTSFQFNYYDENNNLLATPVADPNTICLVQIVVNTQSREESVDVRTAVLVQQNNPTQIKLSGFWATDKTAPNQFTNPENGYNAPDSVYATGSWPALENHQTYTGYGSGGLTQAITKIELVIVFYIDSALSNDWGKVWVTGVGGFYKLETEDFNEHVGVANKGAHVIDITADNDWELSDLDNMEVSFLLQPKGEVDGATFYLDAVGFRIQYD